MEQLTGMAWVTGYEGGPPIIPGGLVDPMVGAHAALAIVAALEHRERTGEGQLVEVPLVEVATAVTAEQVIRYAIDGTLLDRRGAGGVYRDRRATTSGSRVDRDRRPDVTRRAGRVVRDAHRRRTRPPSCAPQGIAAAAMVRGYETLDDPQLRARGFFEPLDNPLVGRHEYPTWPMRMSAGPRALLDRSRADTWAAHRRGVARDSASPTRSSRASATST